MQDKKLIHRLNRIQGQINAIKEKLSESSPDDCEQVLIQLKAVTRGLKKFGEAYVNATMQECFAQKTDKDGLKEVEQQIASAIHSAFNM